MHESIKVLSEMCFLFHANLIHRGFSKKEALKLTQAFVYATLNKSKEEKNNG